MATSISSKINRSTFFLKIRKEIFNGKLMQSQVDGMETILDEWESRGLNEKKWLAYILATTYHESGHTFQPISEYGRGNGRKYGVPDPITGKIYYGRGFCQLTWKANYQTFSNLLKVDLVHNPDLAMDCKIATDIIFEGMLRGLFTGKKLADYLNATTEDFVNARRIINGTDLAVTIAVYARKFYSSIV